MTASTPHGPAIIVPHLWREEFLSRHKKSPHLEFVFRECLWVEKQLKYSLLFLSVPLLIWNSATAPFCLIIHKNIQYSEIHSRSPVLGFIKQEEAGSCLFSSKSRGIYFSLECVIFFITLPTAPNLYSFKKSYLALSWGLSRNRLPTKEW